MPDRSDDPARAFATRRPALRYVTVAWLFGSMWFTGIGGAPFTRFATAMGATEIHFGILSALPFLAAILSLPASLWIDASGDRKRIFLIAQLTQRFMWFGVALLPIYLLREKTQANRQLALFAFMSMLVVANLVNAVGTPAWVSWMADVVPDRIRGRYFARRRQWGFVTAIPTALLAGLIVDRFVPLDDDYAALRWCGGLFAVVSVAGVMDILLFYWVPHTVHARAHDAGPVWQTLARPLRDRNFITFCLYIGALTAAVAPMGQFTTLYLIERLGIGATQVQIMLLVAPMLGQFFIVPLWGHMADRYGRKPMLAIASFGLVPVGLGWCAMNFGHVWLGYVLAIGGAMLWSATEIANFNLVIEMSGSGGTDEGEAVGGRGSGYTAVNTVILAISGALGGLGAGWLMWGLRDVHVTLGLSLARPFGAYEILFAASALLRLLATVIFLPRLHEHEARSTKEAIEFMADNLYSNVVGVIVGPIRRFFRAS